MKKKLTHVFQADTGFRVLDTTERSQAGLLTLEAGEASSDRPSVHAESDQVLVILQGELMAEIDGGSDAMREGGAVVMPAKTPHKFTNTGPDRAVTFSVYRGPAFPPDKKSS